MISMIIATDRNDGIGKDNKLPWPHNRDDMKWFVRNTRNKSIIMGRKTFESLGSKPLKDRKNIVLTRNVSGTVIRDDGVIYCNDLKDAIRWGESYSKEVVCIGGAEIYKLFFPLVTRIYWTLFNQVYDTDAKFEISQMVTNQHEFQYTISDKRTMFDNNSNICGHQCILDRLPYKGPMDELE